MPSPSTKQSPYFCPKCKARDLAAHPRTPHRYTCEVCHAMFHIEVLERHLKERAENAKPTDTPN